MKGQVIREDPMDRSRFPVDEWRLVESTYSTEDLGVTETLFAIGNGYLGMRGNPPEGRDSYAPGTYINGFHETWPIRHAEEAYGFAKTGQTIVNAPDSKLIKIYVDDEPLTLSVADLESYERALDMRNGMLTRDLVWRTPAGKRVQISSRQMVSFADRHVALFEVKVTMLEGDAPVVLSSQLVNRQDGFDDYSGAKSEAKDGFDPRRATGKLNGRVLQPQGDWSDGERIGLGYRTTNSRMSIAVTAQHELETDNEWGSESSVAPDVVKQVFRVEAREGEPVTLRKIVAYHTSRGVPVAELFDRCRRTLARMGRHGFDEVVARQREWMEEFWRTSDVVIEGRPALQQAVRWCLFQLAQAAARSDQLGIPAKGVTGSGYEGHYFWDTDVYVVPFLIYTNPGMARNALRFRVNVLPHARERARELSVEGALYPWRTINGEEASAYYAAGTAQYHIDADVAYAFSKYGDVTGDEAFMARDGAVVLAETARMWADLGFWRTERDGSHTFHIHGVTGPDEYTTVVNNNLFTNVMARANLRRAADIVDHLREHDPVAFAHLVEVTDLRDDEPIAWRECADGMVILYDDQLGIHPQDETFLQSELWDLEGTPPENYPLLLNYHPLVIYRFQVLKQADVVLALLLQGEDFTLEEKRSDFEYYDPITTGDSTLSAVVQSVIAAETGYQDMAMHYFLSGLFVDLADLHSNARDGVHIASAGGVWNALVYGFAGMRDYHGNLTFDPRLPQSWPGMQFPLQVRGSQLRVRLRPKEISFTLESGEPVEVSVRGEQVTVTDGDPVTVPLDGQGPRLPSLSPGHPIVGHRRADGSLISAMVPLASGEPGPEASATA